MSNMTNILCVGTLCHALLTPHFHGDTFPNAVQLYSIDSLHGLGGHVRCDSLGYYRWRDLAVIKQQERMLEYDLIPKQVVELNLVTAGFKCWADKPGVTVIFERNP